MRDLLISFLEDQDAAYDEENGVWLGLTRSDRAGNVLKATLEDHEGNLHHFYITITSA